MAKTATVYPWQEVVVGRGEHRQYGTFCKLEKGKAQVIVPGRARTLKLDPSEVFVEVGGGRIVQAIFGAR